MGQFSRDNRKSKSGFTLMEVLVAMALSSVIMVALFGMFNAVVDVATGVKARENATYAERTLEFIMFDDLRSLYPQPRGDDFEFVGKNGSFLGDDGLLMGFCTTATLSSTGTEPTCGLQRVEYSLKGGFGNQTLYRSERSFAGRTGDWEPVEVPILKGVEELEVEYLNSQDEEYVTEWDSMGDFPLAVKVRLTHDDGKEHDFIVSLSTVITGTK